MRITLWPGVPLATPRPTRCPEYRLSQSRTALIGSGNAIPIDRRARLGEIYLQTRNVDLDDPESILKFANEYGPLRGSTLFFLERNSLFAGRGTAGFEPGEHEAILAAETSDIGFLEITMLRTFVESARFIRDLTTAWEVVSNRQRSEADFPAWEVSSPHADSDPRLYAALLLETGLNGLLSRLNPTLRLGPPQEDYESAEEDLSAETTDVRDAHWEGVELTAAPTLPDLLLEEVCGLELYNHIARRKIYRTCKNERCQRTFVRQYGRGSPHGTPRDDSLYCTDACARAQAQRNYRARKSAKQREEATHAPRQTR